MACLAVHPLSVVVGVFMKRANASSSCGWRDLRLASRMRSAAFAAMRLVLLARNFCKSGEMVALPIPRRALSLVSVASMERSGICLRCLRSTEGGVHFAVLLQPRDVSLAGVRFNLAQQFDRL